MKKGLATTGFLAITFVALSVTSVAAESRSASSGADARVGGLGTGLNSMVRSILNDESLAPQPTTAVPAAQTMMMNAPATAGAAQAPQARAMKAEASNVMFSTEALAQTEEDVRMLIRSLLQNDSHMQSIDASETHVRLTYRTQGTVLKFLKVTIPVTGEAYVSGKTTVTYPWYATIAGIQPDVRTRFDERIAPQIAAESLSPDNRIQLVSEMHSFFTGEFAL